MDNQWFDFIVWSHKQCVVYYLSHATAQWLNITRTLTHTSTRTHAPIAYIHKSVETQTVPTDKHTDYVYVFFFYHNWLKCANYETLGELLLLFLLLLLLSFTVYPIHGLICQPPKIFHNPLWFYIFVLFHLTSIKNNKCSDNFQLRSNEELKSLRYRINSNKIADLQRSKCSSITLSIEKNIRLQSVNNVNHFWK